MEGTRVSGRGVCVGGGRLWQLAVFVAVGTLGLASQAQAAIYYWQDSAPGVAQPAPREPVRRAKSTHHGEKRSRAVVEKESKPQGPLIISISIAQQKLRIYDAHGLFAETPISTGMPGHLTPMGVFSIIQKQKFHRSNIYSGAPMPFMQRITWSGVAMHAGVLPGHPASHGCIRMPMAFAVKMYGWTRMGARVIVAPGDVTPASFAHPLLAAVKVTPQPVAVQETKADVVTIQKIQQPAEASAPPAVTEAKVELRPTVGHVEETKPAAQVQTADASGALPASLSTSATPDSATAGERASQPLEVTASDHRDASKTTTDADAPKPEIDPIAAKHDEAAALNEKPERTTPVETASDQPAKPEAATVANEATKPSDKAASATPTELKAKTNTESQGEKPASATATAPAALPAATSETQLKGDIKSDFAKTAASKTDPGFSFKNTGQIAVFVSRKDSKLYVRQNFSPLFDVPVTIAPDARPLGTHIFTAQVDGSDANVLHWSVVSLPVPSRPAGRHAEDERNLRGRRFASAGPIQAKPVPMPDDPAEALDRLNLPAEVMAKIYEAVSTGGSIIVSDQGIAAGETGEGTDFIVSLR